MNDECKKDSLKYYINTIQKTSYTLETIINFDNISKNLKTNKSNLEKLNYLICDSKNEFKERLEILFRKEPKIFKCLPLLIGSRKNREIMHTINDEQIEVQKIDYFTQNTQMIMVFFLKTKLLDEIIKKNITDFVQYARGVEVGMYSNKRKNITGTTRENYIFNFLEEELKKYDDFVIKKQQKIVTSNSELNKKIFDFLITNKKNDKIALIECSFYNAPGSKISETCRAYQTIHKLVKEYTNYEFIWLADGKGMESIERSLEECFDKGYICNTHTLMYKLKKYFIL